MKTFKEFLTDSNLHESSDLSAILKNIDPKYHSVVKSVNKVIGWLNSGYGQNAKFKFYSKAFSGSLLGIQGVDSDFISEIKDELTPAEYKSLGKITDDKVGTFKFITFSNIEKL